MRFVALLATACCGLLLVSALTLAETVSPECEDPPVTESTSLSPAASEGRREGRLAIGRVWPVRQRPADRGVRQCPTPRAGHRWGNSLLAPLVI